MYKVFEKVSNQKTLIKMFVEIILYNSEFFTPVFVLGPVVVFVHTDRVIDSV